MSSLGAYSSSVDFRIGQNPPDNLSPELKAALQELYTSFQLMIATMIDECGISGQLPSIWQQVAEQDPVSTLNSGNLNRLYVKASEALSQGSVINLWNDAGTLKARKANATNNTKPCDGFCSTVGGIASGSFGEVQIHSGVATVTGLTVGDRYYLSTTNGAMANAPAVAAGNIEQYLGIAITTTQLAFNAHYWIQH